MAVAVAVVVSSISIVSLIIINVQRAFANVSTGHLYLCTKYGHTDDYMALQYGPSKCIEYKNTILSNKNFNKKRTNVSNIRK